MWDDPYLTSFAFLLVNNSAKRFSSGKKNVESVRVRYLPFFTHPVIFFQKERDGDSLW